MNSRSNKIIVFGIVLSIILIIISISVSAFVIINNNGKTRTIMIYMVGANLESKNGLATADLNSINNQIANEQNVNVLVIAGGSESWDNDYIDKDETSIYKLTNSGFTKVKTQKIQNMGSSSTLSSFLEYAYANSKTDEYDLIFWNHGGAIDGSEYDELNNDDNLSLKELNSSLANSPFKNKKLEMVIFRTCLNGTLEVNTIFSKYAKYLVASEEVTLGASNTSVLNFINDIDQKDNSEMIGKRYIDAYKKQIADIRNHFPANDDDSIYSTYSLIDLSKISKLNKSIDDFFADIDVNSNFNTISKVRANLYQYAQEEPNYDMVDLYNLVEQLQLLSSKKGKKVLDNINNTVIYNFATDSNSRGLSVYFPYNGEEAIKKRFMNAYSDLDGLNNYKGFIDKVYNIKTSDYKRQSYATNLLKSETATEDDSYAGFELELTDEQVENFASAKYIVYQDLKTGYYKPIYFGKNTTLDGNTLRADIKDYQLKVVGTNDERSDLIAVEQENNDKYIKYNTTVLLQSFKGDISNWKNDVGIMTLYYDKDNKKIDMSQIVYSDKNDLPNSSVVNLKEYDNVGFSISSGWTILDEQGNYTGPVTENGKVKGDGIITGFEEKPGKFKFEFSKFDRNYDYYCVFAIKDTHNNTSYSKMIKLK